MERKGERYETKGTANFAIRTKSSVPEQAFTFSGGGALKDKVSLEYWQDRVNIGDQLAPVIFDWMMKQNQLENRCNGIRHLTTVGSIIGCEKFDAVIWGSGVLSMGAAKSIFRLDLLIKYDVRAVRGPITREILMLAGYDVPEVYGDPGILMPLIYSPESVEKVHDAGLILHYKSELSPEERMGLYEIDVCTADHAFFIDEILRCRRVISSSLHGIILAEAYGVPAVFLNEGTDELLKFIDWYHSTGRTEIKIARSVAQALEMDPMPLPELGSMQQGLMEAFPRDIFC